MSIKSIHPDLRWVLIFMCVVTLCICAALLLLAFPASEVPMIQCAALGMAVLIILVGSQISICADA
jgi:competence protein ComGC